MKSLSIGMLIVFGAIVSILTGTSLSVFLNLHAIGMVFAGTIGVFMLSNPSSEIKTLLVCLKHLFQNRKTEAEVKTVLVSLSQNKQHIREHAHPLVAYAHDLWDKGLEHDIIEALLVQKVQEMEQAGEKAISSMKNLSKYPPALGMMGTVVGLVSLFSNLSADNKSSIGPMLALAMTATFYGLLLANVILMPLTDRLQINELARNQQNDRILKILLLIHHDESSKVVEDELNHATA